MIVVANGRERDVDEGATVEAFIRAMSLDPRAVIVEHNGEALARALFAGTILHDGDRVELVRAVAGG